MIWKQIQSLEIVSSPKTSVPAPIGLAARVRVNAEAYGTGILTNLLNGPAEGWLLIGVTNVP
jgi:hypothetical protein